MREEKKKLKQNKINSSIKAKKNRKLSNFQDNII